VTCPINHLIPLACLALTVALTARGEVPVAEEKQRPTQAGKTTRTDLNGDSLPTGKETRVLRAHASSTIRLWNGTTGKELLRLKGHTGEVHGLAFAPDGHLLASRQWSPNTRPPDNDICLWDVRTGKLIRR
jgi:WD40 repeat protein